MTILEIESYQGEVFLYGKSIAPSKLKWQLREIEKIYDREEDNFIELFCRRFAWTILRIEEAPDYTYDRDTGILFVNKLGEDFYFE